MRSTAWLPATVPIDVVIEVLALVLPWVGEEDGNVIRALGIFPLAMV